ncbi:MAG: DUF3226 domain-containing protein [Planctomycetota bacterium]|jgi:hypothetical protein
MDSDLPKEIRSKKLLVVEGDDDVGFFLEMLHKMHIANVYVVGLSGKNRFNDELPRLQKVRGFSAITHLAVIRDQDLENAFESVKNLLSRKMGLLNIPSQHGEFVSGRPRIGVFIMPGDTITGTALEDLCLKTVETHPAMKCVDEFMSCVSVLETKPKNIPKAKAQTFLAAQPEIANSVGLGAQKNYWNFESSALDELKEFLNNLK